MGPSGVGKTAFVHRHLTGEFIKPYMATIGAEVHPLVFHTSKGPVRFNIFDCAGQAVLLGNGNEWWNHADCAIVMSDYDKSTLEQIPYWMGKIPVGVPKVLCYNMLDLKNQVERRRQSVFRETAARYRAENVEQFMISVKSCQNIEAPLLHLARALLQDPELQFIEPEDVAE